MNESSSREQVNHFESEAPAVSSNVQENARDDSAKTSNARPKSSIALRPLYLLLVVLRFILLHFYLLIRFLFAWLLSVAFPARVTQSLHGEPESSGEDASRDMSTPDRTIEGHTLLVQQKESHRNAFEFISLALKIDEDHDLVGKLIYLALSMRTPFVA